MLYVFNQSVFFKIHIIVNIAMSLERKMKWSKKSRIIISIVAFIIFSIFSINRVIENNSRSYIEHPDATLLGAVTPNIFVAIGFYWLFGIQRKRPNWTPSFLKAKSIDRNKKDDWAFEQAANELESGEIDKSIWARAFSEAKGDEPASKANYISLRVERLVSSKVIDDQKSTDIKPESDESLVSRKYFNRLLVGLVIVAMIAVIYLVASASSEPRNGVDAPVKKPFRVSKEWKPLSFEEWKRQREQLEKKEK